MRGDRVIIGMWAAGLVVAGGLGGILALGDLRASAPSFLGLYALTFAGFLAALLLARGARPTRATLALVLFAALAFRLLVVGAEPSLSDDLYRYLWDGRVQAAGLNPFVYPPAAPELAWLRDAVVHSRINHPEISTIYPPAAQLLFLAARGPLDSPQGIKLLFALLDFGTTLVLWRILARRGRALWVVAHAWNPLCILELAHSGHMDAWPLFLLVVALERADAGRHLGAALALGLSAGAKFFALALLPFFGRRWRPTWIVVPAVIGALYLPYLGAGGKLFGGLGAFTSRWRFNDSAFALLDGSLRASLGPGRWSVPALDLGRPNPDHLAHVARQLGGHPFDLDRALARIEEAPAPTLAAARYGAVGLTTDKLAHRLAQGIAAVLLGLLILFLWRRSGSLEQAALLVFGAMLILSPTVQPWYVTWLVPLAALCRSWTALAWSGTAVLAYAVFLRPAGSAWAVPPAALAAEYALPALVAGILWWRRRRLVDAVARNPYASPK